MVSTTPMRSMAPILPRPLGAIVSRTGEGAAMSDKPSYLSLLNGIAVGEARTNRYLKVWIETTTDLEVESLLRTVAAREGEHAMSFARRVDELGYTVRVHEDPKEVEELEVAASDRSDLEKLEYFGL